MAAWQTCGPAHFNLTRCTHCFLHSFSGVELTDENVAVPVLLTMSSTMLKRLKVCSAWLGYFHPMIPPPTTTTHTVLPTVLRSSRRCTSRRAALCFGVRKQLMRNDDSIGVSLFIRHCLVCVGQWGANNEGTPTDGPSSGSKVLTYRQAGRHTYRHTVALFYIYSQYI